MRAGIGAVAAGIGLSLLGCVRFDLFGCADSSQCVLNGLSGQCEASGYCSFADPDCDSGSRYSEHAPSELAHQCVDDGATSVAGTDDGASTGGDGSGDDSDAEGSEGDESGTPTMCLDLDGDGAGLGEDCEQSDCDDDNPNATDNCLYIAPDGDDEGAGTSDDPWHTFGYALAQLGPGDSLIIGDGTYTFAEHGTVEATCGVNVVSGSSVAPIFVRAQNDRMAVIDRQSVANGVLVEDCDYWRIRGVSIVGGDQAADDDGLWRTSVQVSGSRDIEIRQVLTSHANRYFNEHLVQVSGSDGVLLEDVEAHDFFRSGFTFYSTDNATCRRCYGHSHGATDLPDCHNVRTCPAPNAPGDLACPKCSAGDVARGDSTFYTERSNGILFENCVSEGSHRGYSLYGGLDANDERAGAGIRVVESVSIDDSIGLEIDSNGQEIPPANASVVDVAIIAPRGDGLRIRDPDGLTLSNITVMQPAGQGVVVVDSRPERCLDGACSLNMDHILVVGAGEDGFDIRVPLEAWSLVSCNAYDSAGTDYLFPGSDTDAIDDARGNVRDCISEAATRLGLDADLCRVYVPEDSTMHDVAGDGVDIGANVTNRRVDGASTPDALWLSDGGFPCGPDPVTPAPIDGERCLDLPPRVALGTAGCPAPAPRG